MAFDLFISSNELNKIDEKFKPSVIEFDKIIKKLPNYDKINLQKPISIDVSKNFIKILRNLETEINLPKKSINNIYLKFGNGSRGGRGINNKGYKFEHKVQTDLLNINSQIYKSVSCEIPSLRDTLFNIIDLSTTNTKRPLIIVKNKLKINSVAIDKREIFSDIRIKDSVKQNHYISIKYGTNVSFFQFGIKKFFNFDSSFSNLSIEFFKFCCFFGINSKLFYNCFFNKIYEQKIIKNISVIKNYKNFLKEAIYKDFWILHGNKKDIDFFFIDDKWLDSFLNFKTIKICYGGIKGGFKRVSILCESSIGKITLSIRPTDGSKIPTHLTGEYKIYK